MREITIWQEAIERFEQQAPGAVMAHLALDRALPANRIDEVFQTHRQRQYPRELLFSSVVELMLLVTLGLRPSLHVAARKMAERLRVSLAALYAQVQRTEPVVLRALVQGSAEHLLRLAKRMNPRQQTQNRPGERLRRPSPRSHARLHCMRPQTGRREKTLKGMGLNT